MASGKRVSNKRGRSPGARSTKTGERHFQKVQRHQLWDDRIASTESFTIPYGLGKANPMRIPKPPIFARAMSTVKRFFKGF